MKKQGGLVWAGLALVVTMWSAGSAWAGPLKGVQAWAQRVGTNNVTQTLTGNGITNAAERAAIAAAWDEDVFVETALKNKAFGLISHGLTVDRFSVENMKPDQGGASHRCGADEQRRAEYR